MCIVCGFWNIKSKRPAQIIEQDIVGSNNTSEQLGGSTYLSQTGPKNKSCNRGFSPPKYVKHLVSPKKHTMSMLQHVNIFQRYMYWCTCFTSVHGEGVGSVQHFIDPSIHSYAVNCYWEKRGRAGDEWYLYLFRASWWAKRTRDEKLFIQLKEQGYDA